MKDISLFADVLGGVSATGSLDPGGSTIDKYFAEAIIANDATSVLEEAGIIRVVVVGDEQEKVSFPIVRNTQLTWNEVKRNTGGTGTGTDVGSRYDGTQLKEVKYAESYVTTKSASIFLPDTVSLLNKTNFNLYAEVAARDAKRKKEADGIGSLVNYGDTLSYTEGHNLFSCGGFTSATTVGSLSAGSTVDPMDLMKAKKQLAIGSPTGQNPGKPDFILMYPTQYVHLNTHADFAPATTSPGAMMRKAKFDEDGDIVRFDGMDIFVSELVPAVAADTNFWGVAGHAVLVGQRGLTIGRGEHYGVRVSTEDDRRAHGQWKIFDLDYGYTPLLVPEMNILLRAAD